MASELRKLVADRRLWLGPLPWLIILLVALNVLIHAYGASLQMTRVSTLLMADPTATTIPSNANYDMSCGERVADFWPFIPDARRCRLVTLCGMSQMHAINESKPGDRITCQILDDELKGEGTRIWGQAAPNLCNEEAALQMIAFCAEPQTTPAVYIYGLCFDKFRNVDLRPGYQDLIRARPDVETAWKATAQKYAAKYPLASAKMLASLEDLKTTSGADQNSFEAHLRSDVGSVIPLVGSRKDIYAFVTDDLLYKARNKLFRITPTSKRPIIESRYDLNKQFLSLMADVAKEHHVQMVVYIIPLNPLADNPYVAEEYATFKVYAKQWALDRGIPFANFQDIVPNGEWGYFMGGPDFKHFKEAGHLRTAAAIENAFKPWLLGTADSSTSLLR